MRFLGWDCANKTLAWSYFDIDTAIYTKLNNISNDLNNLIITYCGHAFLQNLPNGLNDQYRKILVDNLADVEFTNQLSQIVRKITNVLDNFIVYKSAGVADVLLGKKVNECDEIYRTKCLWNFLNNHAHLNIRALDHLPGEKTQVIIEHQPSKIGSKTNNKSTMVSHQLAFYYVNNDPILVESKLKNTIYLSNDLKYDLFLKFEMDKGKDKKSSGYVSRKAHSKANFIYLLKTFNCDHILTGISKQCYDDLADSTMQVLAYLINKNLFT